MDAKNYPHNTWLYAFLISKTFQVFNDRTNPVISNSAVKIVHNLAFLDCRPVVEHVYLSISHSGVVNLCHCHTRKLWGISQSSNCVPCTDLW